MGSAKSGMQDVVSFIAGEDITDRYCLILDPTTAGQVLLPTADGQECIAFANDGATSGHYVPGHISGGTRMCIASGTITKGDLLIAASGGKVKTATGSGTEYLVGKALESKTDGQRIEIKPLFQVVAY